MDEMMTLDLTQLDLYPGEEHRPFLLPGGRPAALLIHGFPGTPKEVRPLADVLHPAGWTVQGLLLPGFGADIGTLFQRRYQEWVAAADAALRALQAAYSPVLLVGYSMGAAVALNVAHTRPPDGLLLAAPFWQLGNWWQRALWHGLKPIFRQLQPFKKADFADPRIRQAVGGVMPDVDVDDPAVQAALRQLRIPAGLFDQLLDLGRAAKAIAPQVQVPTLVIQGTLDETVTPALTRRLLQALGGPLQYAEFAADHDLLDPALPSWPALASTVCRFAAALLPDGGERIPLHDSLPGISRPGSGL